MIRQTSINSFVRLNETNIGERHYLIYSMFRNYGVPATDMEVCRANNIADPNFLRPRRHELFKMGLLREGEKRPCSITGKLAIEWVVV